MSLLKKLAAATGLVLTVSVIAGAQASPEQILERYTKTVDPNNVLTTTDGFVTTAEMEVPAAGMTATIKTAQRRPNQIIMKMSMPGIGEVTQGYDGTTAWSIDPMQGPRILSEDEAKVLVDGADIRTHGRSMDLFSAAEPESSTEVSGETVDCVKLTWKTGRVTTECFSRESGLMVQSTTTQSSVQGDITVTTNYSDYKAVGGVTLPHRMEQSAMGMQQIVRLTNVQVGGVNAAEFELPAEIKALKNP